MQDLINMSLAEIRRDEYKMQTAKVEAHQWKHESTPAPALRANIASALIALAARIAPVTREQTKPATPTPSVP